MLVARPRGVDSWKAATDTTRGMDVATAQTEGDVLRRHAVVVHADIADYSRQLADDAAATVATVAAYRRLVTGVVDSGGGALVNFVGDSFLAVFDEARAAMRATVSICAAIRERNRGLPDHRRTWFRFGVDAGEIMVADDGRHFGDALNIAARIQTIAQPGGVNVTGAVYAELDEPALRLVALGSRRLKNIPEMIRVYRLAGIGDDVADPPPADPGVPSVAVLPTVAAGDAAERAIADALRVDLVRALGDVPGLLVTDVGPTLGDSSAGLGDLEARYLLQSRVVRSGTRVRAYAKLMEVGTMNQVWADRWEGSADDVFALQDLVSAGTVRAMEIELVVGQPATIYRDELDAAGREIVYRGWHQLGTGTRDGWRDARELFTSLVRTRPDARSGYALAAFACWWGAIEGLSDAPERDYSDAAAYATQGVDLDDPSGLSHMVVASLRLHAGADMQAALNAAEVALERRPSCDVSFGVLGSVQRYLGDWQSAVEACRRAQELSPLNHEWYGTIVASAYYVGERYHDAARSAERVIERQPDKLEALLVLAASQQALGLTRRTRATVVNLLERFPEVRREHLRERHPFRDPAILDRWMTHLAAAGVP